MAAAAQSVPMTVPQCPSAPFHTQMAVYPRVAIHPLRQAMWGIDIEQVQYHRSSVFDNCLQVSASEMFRV
jgi:hypothetical protein